MLDRIPVGSVSLNDIDINISLLTYSNPIYIPEWVSITCKNGKWQLIHNHMDSIDILLEKILFTYADEHFSKEDFEKLNQIKYFVIEEVNNNE